MAKDKVIKAKKMKSGGYGDRTFPSYSSLVPGDIADVSGSFADGYFIASSFEVQPDYRSDFDRIVDTIDNRDYSVFSPKWNDRSKRKDFFGDMVEGIGRVVDDAELQDYIQKLGLSLVPDYIKARTNFLFIVVSNSKVNANIRPNGLAYINTGLLLKLENEAQLAAVLSHEISHNIYKHMASTTDRNKANMFQKYLSGLAKNKIKNDKTGLADVAEDLSGSIFDLRLSSYNVDQETQADQVGLSLMANAGYDPRQAAVVWKNLYNTYGIASDRRDDMIKNIDKINKITDTSTDGTKAAPNDKGTKLMGNALSLTADEMKSQSYSTHPGNKGRFENLNALIEMYWSDPALLDKAELKKKPYLKVARGLVTRKPEPAAAPAPKIGKKK